MALSSSSSGRKLLALKVKIVREGVLGETETGIDLVAELVEDVSKTAESAAEPPEQVVLTEESKLKTSQKGRASLEHLGQTHPSSIYPQLR